jgi:hypothetical protein
MRSPLALLLVLHYLLTGVLGGAWVVATRADAPSAQHPYVHSVLCQTHNYLRLDCFDQCNGEQPGHLLKQLVAGDDDVTGDPQTKQTKAQLDYHLLVETPLVPTRPLYARALRPARLLISSAAVLGVFAVEGPPPRVAPATAG